MTSIKKGKYKKFGYTLTEWIQVCCLSDNRGWTLYEVCEAYNTAFKTDRKPSNFSKDKSRLIADGYGPITPKYPNGQPRLEMRQLTRKDGLDAKRCGDCKEVGRTLFLIFMKPWYYELAKTNILKEYKKQVKPVRPAHNHG